MPATRIRLYREQGMAIRLAYGRTDLSRPRYDLALLAPVFFAARIAGLLVGQAEDLDRGHESDGLSSPLSDLDE